MIPPIYILITVWFPDMGTRARYFGVVSGAAALGSAAGPLIGGLITSAVSWRASFVVQAIVVGVIIVLARDLVDPPRTKKAPRFDYLGTVLSAAGLVLIVFGILQSGKYGWVHCREDYSIGNTVIIHEGGISPVWLYVAAGVAVLGVFFCLHPAP